jgi:hypothetical protein
MIKNRCSVARLSPLTAVTLFGLLVVAARSVTCSESLNPIRATAAEPALAEAGTVKKQTADNAACYVCHPSLKTGGNHHYALGRERRLAKMERVEGCGRTPTTRIFCW